MRVLLICLLVLALVPGWSGEEPRARLGSAVQMSARRVALEPADPARRRVGGLVFLGGIALASRDAAFGGFSSLAVAGDRFLLLADTGNWVRFGMGRDWRPHDLAFGDLPGGPGPGWEKRDRDSESLARDPASGRLWVGFERANAIWRYDAAPTRAERHAAPHAMRDWEENGGPESLVRLADGRFVSIAEQRVTGDPRGTRRGLVFLTDPTEAPWPAIRFTYRPTPRYDVADMAELPDGRLVVIERRFAPPFRFSNRLMLIDRAALREGASVTGTPLADIAAPLIHDNFEGVAAACEAGRSVLWLVSDDNQSLLQRTLLLKFALADAAPCASGPHSAGVQAARSPQP